MPRPPSPPWTLGNIATKQVPERGGIWVARGYYRDENGDRREATASGKTEPSARRALQAKVSDARSEHRGGDRTLRNDTKVGKAAGIWLEHARRKRNRDGNPLSPGTLEQYEGNARRYVTGSAIHNLPLAQVNDVARIEAWLAGIADHHGEGAATAARKVLSGILALAERRGAIQASVMRRVETPGASAGSQGDRKCADPDCDFDCGRRHLDTRRAFTVDEARSLFDAADDSGADVADLAAFLFGTGARIREALHSVHWRDLNLEARTVRIRGTKTAAADRTVMLSEDLTERLRTRASLYGTKGLVFGVTRYPTKLGEPRDVNNVLKALRRVLVAAGLSWAGSHTFRRTVATWMDEAGSPLAEIAAQLGHANTTVTTRYLARKVAPTRAATVMAVPPKERPELAAVPG